MVVNYNELLTSTKALHLITADELGILHIKYPDYQTADDVNGWRKVEAAGLVQNNNPFYDDLGNLVTIDNNYIPVLFYKLGLIYYDGDPQYQNYNQLMNYTFDSNFQVDGKYVLNLNYFSEFFELGFYSDWEGSTPLDDPPVSVIKTFASAGILKPSMYANISDFLPADLFPSGMTKDDFNSGFKLLQLSKDVAGISYKINGALQESTVKSILDYYSRNLDVLVSNHSFMFSRGSISELPPAHAEQLNINDYTDGYDVTFDTSSFNMINNNTNPFSGSRLGILQVGDVYATLIDQLRSSGDMYTYPIPIMLWTFGVKEVSNNNE